MSPPVCRTTVQTEVHDTRWAPPAPRDRDSLLAPVVTRTTERGRYVARLLDARYVRQRRHRKLRHRAWQGRLPIIGPPAKERAACRRDIARHDRELTQKPGATQLGTAQTVTAIARITRQGDRQAGRIDPAPDCFIDLQDDSKRAAGLMAGDLVSVQRPTALR